MLSLYTDRLFHFAHSPSSPLLHIRNGHGVRAEKRESDGVCAPLPPPSNRKAEWVVVASAQQANAALNCKSRPFSPLPLLAAVSASPPKKAATHKKLFPPLQAAQQRKFRIKAREEGGKMMSVGGEALIWVSPPSQRGRFVLVPFP